MRIQLVARACAALMAMAIVGANAQTPEREPKRPDLSVETRDNFKNIQAIDPDLAKQARDLLRLRQIPSDQNATIAPGLIANSVRLPPPFLLEIARRLWEMGRQEDAFEWYALALVRARYDAGKCVDPTAQQVLLPPIAANVAGGVSQFRSAFSEAGLRAIARSDAFSSAVSPWWACSQGMAAIKAGFEKRSIEQSAWLKPQSDWEPLRANITRELAAFFREQSRPDDDPILMSKTAYKVMTIGVGDFNNFAWLDEQRLVFGEWADRKARPLTTILRQWHNTAPVEELARFSSVWCAGQGVIAYILNHGGENGKPRQVTFAIGEPGKISEKVVEFESYARYAQFMHDGSRGVTFSSDTKRQSSFDCRWVTSDVLTGKKDTEWIPLLPEHGFLLFNGPNSEAADKILYYPTETSAPIVLPMRASDIPIHAVRYFAYKRAYFISRLSIPRDRLDKNSNCAPVWWFFPEDARTEEVCAPNDAIGANFPTYWPSRVGMLRIATIRHTPHGEKPGGIYLTSSEGRTAKIFEGRMRVASLSPDGCKVAAASYVETRDIKTSMNQTLVVIDLCSMDQSSSATTAK